MSTEELNVVYTPTPEEVMEAVEKLTEELEAMTPEALAAHIREIVLAGRRSRHHRAAFKKGDLKALAAWERELTNGYGVERRSER